VHLGERLRIHRDRPGRAADPAARTIWVRLHVTRATDHDPRPGAGSPAPTAVRRIRTSRPVVVPTPWTGPSTDPLADLLADDLAA
jgi:hypothetical protein